MIGATLSHYRIESRLGRGGMGEVYLARDTRLGRTVAIKLLPAEAGSSDDRIRRFAQEAKAASSLNHPNIVTIHDVDQQGDLRFIVMEHVDGVALNTLAATPMPLDHFLDLASQVTSALAAAHEAGIVHRDIKPANVMLSHSGRVKVVDFGLARLSTPSEPDSDDQPTEEWAGPQTKPGAVLGTVGYMSPEQIQGRRVDQRSDVFSTGVLFYELLTGRRAFDGATQLEVIASILRDQPAPVTSIRADVPLELADIVGRCLSKNADERFASARELHDALETLRRAPAPAAPVLRRRTRAAIGAALALLLIGAAAGFFWWRQTSRARWVRRTLPEVQRLVNADDIDGAFRLVRQGLAVAPDDPQLQQFWANVAQPVEITSDPPGAEVVVKGYRSTREWIPLGRTPLRGASIPFALDRVRFTLEGHTPVEVAPNVDDVLAVRLYRSTDTPPGMVAVPGGEVAFVTARATVPDFWIDRHEVTNREYRRFISAGGYRKSELWKYPVVKDGRTLSWEEAMQEFVDATGRPGPSRWQLGEYPPGADDLPVEGVSWYEAAAYAEYAGKSLPTVFHWMRATGEAPVFSDILTMSNFASDGPARVGSRGGVGTYGTYDLAGNVSEWCLNASGENRYRLGGSWLDPSYRYLEEVASTPISRGQGDGFRLIRQSVPIAREALREVSPETASPPEPVDDATYRVYASLFEYDRTPLNARQEWVDESHAAWRREKVSFDAAYGGERVPAFVFLPKNAKPPYQTVVYFPASDAVIFKSSQHLWLHWVEFFIRSGRAVIYPVYKGTYERRVEGSLGPRGRLDLRIQRIKDVRRTVDYINSRSDLDSQRVAYYGLSLGANQGAIALAVEPRFKMAVLLAGGWVPATVPPEGQNQNYLPRVTVPVLYLTGRNDFSYSYEKSQRPFFELLGTAADRKKHVVVAGGHVPSDYAGAVREILTWTDRWLGPVETR